MEYPKNDRETWHVKHFLDCQSFNIRQLQFDPHGGMGWQHLQLDERYIRKAVAWYRHKYQSPHEWRPHIIIDALCRTALPDSISRSTPIIVWRSG